MAIHEIIELGLLAIIAAALVISVVRDHFIFRVNPWTGVDPDNGRLKDPEKVPLSTDCVTIREQLDYLGCVLKTLVLMYHYRK